MQVLGLRPYEYKLMAFVLASFLAPLGGVVYLLLHRRRHAEVTTANFTLTLLVMVVIGGTGTRWGAMIGGALYTLLDQRLGPRRLGRDRRPARRARKPLAEPMFVLGVLFILLVFFVPGGIAGFRAGAGRGRWSGWRRRRAAVEGVT